MAVVTFEVGLASNLASGSSINTPYPTGNNDQGFSLKSGNVATNNNNIYTIESGRVSVGFANGNVSITNKSGEIWPAGKILVTLNTESSASIRGSVGSDGSLALTNFSAAALKGASNGMPKLQRWYRAVADAQFAPARVNWVGDSTVYGYFSDNVTLAPTQAVANENSAAGQFRTMCANFFGARGEYVPYGGAGVTISGGNPLGLGFGLGAFGSALNASGTVTTVIPGATNLYVHSWNNTGTLTVNGAGSFTINGGSSVATPLISGVSQYNKVSSAVGLNAGSANTIVWTAPSGSYQGYCGLEYHSGKGVIVGRFGRGGNTLSDFLGHGKLYSLASDRWPFILDGFDANSPDLTIIQFNLNETAQINDPTAKCTPAEYEADLRQVCTRLTVTGTGCVLLLADSQASNYGTGVQAQYEAVMEKVAADFAHVEFRKISDIMGTYAEVAAAGLMGDTTHFKRQGYGLIARSMFNALVLDAAPNYK